MRAAGLSGYVKRRKFRTTFGVPGRQGRRRPGRARLQPAGAEPAVGLGHQVRLDLGGHALSGLGDRLLQPQGRRLVDARRHAGRARRRRGGDGDRAPAAGRGAGPSLRPGVAIRRADLRADAAQGRDRAVDGLEGAPGCNVIPTPFSNASYSAATQSPSGCSARAWSCRVRGGSEPRRRRHRCQRCSSRTLYSSRGRSPECRRAS